MIASWPTGVHCQDAEADEYAEDVLRRLVSELDDGFSVLPYARRLPRSVVGYFPAPLMGRLPECLNSKHKRLVVRSLELLCEDVRLLEQLLGRRASPSFLILYGVHYSILPPRVCSSVATTDLDSTLKARAFKGTVVPLRGQGRGNERKWLDVSILLSSFPPASGEKLESWG